MEAEGPITCLAASVRPRFTPSCSSLIDFVRHGPRTMPGLPEALIRTYERMSRVNMTCPVLSPQTLEGMLSDRSLLTRALEKLQSHLSMLPSISPTIVNR